MQKYSDIVLFNGQPLSGASVMVSNYPSGTPATIYIDNGITLGPNPITTDLNGRYSFYAANGRYSLQISYPNAITQTILDFPLENDFTVTAPFTGGIARSIYQKAYDVVSVLDFGAVSDPTGTIDNTAAFNAAFAAGRKILIPAGTYPIRSVTVPSNSFICGEGAGLTTIIPVTGTNPGTMFTSINAQHVEICEMSFNVSRVTASTTYVIYLQTSAYIHVHHVEMANGGVIGIYSLNSTDVLVEDCRVATCASRCIQHDGASSARTKTINCYVSNPGGADHGIQISGGIDHEVLNCYATSVTTFGINVLKSSRVIVSGNTCFNTVHEGINATDSVDVTIDNNIVYWDTTTSQDFGISLSGQTVATNNNLIRGNKVINSGKSGIAIAADGAASLGNLVHGNYIENSNRLNLGATNGGGAGVIVYGSTATNNFVSDNKTFDTIGFLQYGVFEWNTSGFGSPSANKYYANDTSGFALAPSSINTTSYEALTTPDPTTYTPAISASTGALTTASATGNYLLNGKMVFIRIQGTITTNGTGAVSLVFTLPFPAQTGGAAVLIGKESAVTGKTMNCTTSGGSSNLSCVFYDNTYPGANGASIFISGWYVRT